MPTYQYACTGCGEQLEVVQKFTEDPLTDCPSCAGRLRKVFSAVGVVFKGSGFYRTDSRASNGSTASGEKKSPSTADSGTSSSSASSGSGDSGGTSASKPADTKSGGTSGGGSTGTSASSAA